MAKKKTKSRTWDKNKTYVKLINSTRWKKLRDEYIAKNPICECCGEELAQVVHHIIPLQRYEDDADKMEELAYDVNNLQALCNRCHNNIHFGMHRHKNKQETIEENRKKAEKFLDMFFDL